MQMRTLIALGAMVLLAGPMTAAQSADQRAESSKQGKAMTIHGCLTRGQANSFVVTPTQAGDPLSSSVESKTHGVVPTYTYQLSGGQNLDAYVGQIVAATGTVDRNAKGSAKVDEGAEQATTPPSQATPEGKTPKVKVEEKAKIEVRQLAVQSVTSTGKSCSSRD